MEKQPEMSERAEEAWDREQERAERHAQHDEPDDHCLLCLAERDPRVAAFERMSRPGVINGRRVR
jgi:hypothetical protein